MSVTTCCSFDASSTSVLLVHVLSFHHRLKWAHVITWTRWLSWVSLWSPINSLHHLICCVIFRVWQRNTLDMFKNASQINIFWLKWWFFVKNFVNCMVFLPIDFYHSLSLFFKQCTFWKPMYTAIDVFICFFFVKFCALLGVSIFFYEHFPLFFRQWKAGVFKG